MQQSKFFALISLKVYIKNILTSQAMNMLIYARLISAFILQPF